MENKLGEIQKKLKAPKNQRNGYGGFNYRSAEDILEAYKKVAEDTVLILDDEVLQIGERYYIKATAKLILGDKEIGTATAYAREPLSKKGMDESQVTGATSSYARKYALNGLFAIDDSKDSDFSKEDIKKIEEMEKHESEIDMIDNLDDLKTYWEKNKGVGKELVALLSKRKYQLTPKKNEDS